MTYNELCEAILTAREEMLKHKIEANSVTLNGRRYGKLIENCPPNMKPTIFGMAVKADYALPDDYEFLVQYEPPQPQTNADRIRSMTDEDLATWLVYNAFKNIDGFLNDMREQTNISVTYPKDEKRLFENTLRWLKEDVAKNG